MNSAILGISESGKSCLAFEIAETLRRQGEGVISLSTRDHARWGLVSSFHTTNIDDFWHVVNRSQWCFNFVDEAGDWCTHPADERMNILARAFRHEPHFMSTFFIAQRLQYIAPSIRSQCRRLYLFRVGKKDANELAEAWVCDELRDAYKLPFGHYYRVSFNGVKLGQVKSLASIKKAF